MFVSVESELLELTVHVLMAYFETYFFYHAVLFVISLQAIFESVTSRKGNEKSSN